MKLIAMWMVFGILVIAGGAWLGLLLAQVIGGNDALGALAGGIVGMMIIAKAVREERGK